MSKKLPILLLISCFFVACQNENTPNQNDRLIAKVHSKKLFLSDMEGMFPMGTTSEDSTLIIDAYVNRWIRNAVVMHEAEQNVPGDLDIDELVRDYRASLVRHHYEQRLLREKMDSTVTQVELDSFYEENKSQFQLETPIVRCFFLKVKRNAKDLSLAREWWNSDKVSDIKLLQTWSITNAEVAFLSDSTWHRVNEIAALMPNDVISERNVNSRTDLSQREGEYQYFFKVLELVNRQEIAPLSYVENQARKYILHQRQSLILEDYKENMYQEAMRGNAIQIYE